MTSHKAVVELEVPFHDVDPLHVVWHGHYYKYMELARTQLLRGLHLDGQELLDLGFKLFVIESNCRYVFPLRYGDKVKVTARISDYEYRIMVRYEIFNLSQGKRSAKGRTALATTDREGALLLKTPDPILERLHA